MSLKRILGLGAAAWVAAAVAGCSGCSSNNSTGGTGGTGGNGGTGGTGGTTGTSYFLPNKPQGHLVSNRLPSMAVDAAGGVHVAYAANGTDANNRRPAYYAYCASQCTDVSRFAVVELADGLGTAQLALDPSGHPRVLLAVGPDTNNTVDYQYWFCDGACGQAANWHGTSIISGQATFYPSPVEKQQSFAVDAQGRPGFVFYSNSFGASGPTGNVYAHCASGCSDAANWTFATLGGNSEWKNVALAFTPTGLPRMALTSKETQPDYLPYLAYFECDQPDCLGQNRGLLMLYTASAGPSSDSLVSMRLDSAGHPRMVLYPGTGSGGTIPPNRLYFLSCDANCTDAQNGWSQLDIGAKDTGGEGGVDLALDPQGRPRIAYRLPAPTDELTYAWCDSGCLASAQNWKGLVVPATAAAEQELGLPPRQGCDNCSPPIPPCPTAFYDSGYWPSVALDPNGNPRLAFEVELQTGGGQCTAGVLARFSRLTVLSAP